MKRLITKYGLISSALIVGIPLLTIPIIGIGPDTYSIGEVIGYSTIAVAMLLILVAQYSFKKNENDGVMSFGEGFKMGLSISAIGGLAFGIYNVIYVLFIEPDFFKQYFAYMENISVDAVDFEARYSAYAESLGFWYTMPGQFLLMFLTVFLIGFVVSIIGALIFQSKTKMAQA